jgi:hypothetical protein
MLFKGLKIGGWAAFAIITGYQLYKATPAERPKVLAEAAGGLAGGVAATYLVCNALLDIETAGWGIVICGFIAGGAGGYAGSKAAGAVYDEATATDLSRALHQLDGRSANERTVFNIIVGRLDYSADCIDASFVNNFLSTIPPQLQDAEAVLLAAELASAAIGPPASAKKSHGSPAPQFPKRTVCPGCHGRTESTPQPSMASFDEETFKAIMAAPTCSSILGTALSALKTAVGHLPRYYRAPGDIAHHPEPGTSMVTPRSTTSTAVADSCPGGNCHAPSRKDKPLFGSGKPAADADQRAMLDFLQSQKKPADAGNTHATPPGVKLPSPSQGFPSVEQQQGSQCPSGRCHQPAGKEDKFGGFGGFGQFGSGSRGELTDADRQKLIDLIIAQSKK